MPGASSSLETIVVPLEVTLRLAREDDLPRLEWFGWFTRHRAIIRRAFDRQRAGGNLMLLAEAGKFPVGQVWIDVEKYHAQRGALFWALRVMPGFQQAGVGARLLRCAERLAIDHGARWIELGVEKENVEALRFYQRVGYVVTREVEEHYEYVAPDGSRERTYMNEWVLRKRVALVDCRGREPRARARRRMRCRLAVRWTIGDVSRFGFEALRLSVWGAHRLFGEDATYTICVNSIPLRRARALTGELPPTANWRDVSGELSAVVAPHLDRGFAEGVGWKFAPLRLDPDSHELALDNDCIMWRVPEALLEWLENGSRCLIAEDVRPCFGQFAAFCGDAPRNSGIRGVPAGYDLEHALSEMLARHPVTLTSELDEQGLQVAALSRTDTPLVVRTNEVSICSPFPPHQPQLGECGAHFVGLNAKQLPWTLDGRGASEYVVDHWRRHRAELYARVGILPFDTR